MNTLTKKELINKTAIKTNQPVKLITKIFKGIEDTLIECIPNNDEVVFSSKIGKFVSKTQAERTIKRITDQKVITIPATKTIKFKPSKTIKNIVKNIDLKETI